MREVKAGTTQTMGAPWRATLMVAVFAAAWTALASAAGVEPQDNRPREQVEDGTGALAEELGRTLGMTPAEIEALGLSPAEMQRLLAGFTEETVVVGSRASA